MATKKKTTAKKTANPSDLETSMISGMVSAAREDYQDAVAALKCLDKNDIAGAVRILAAGQRDRAKAALVALNDGGE